MDPLTGNLLFIICFIVGSGLILLEAFMPGFGVAGIFGVILEVTAIVTAWLHYGTVFALLATAAALLLITLTVVFSYRSAMSGRLSRSALILKDTEPAEAAAPSSPLEAWLNREGETVTSLRPAGFIEIGGTRISAASRGGFLPRGRKVIVTGVEGDHVVIREKE